MSRPISNYEKQKIEARRLELIQADRQEAIARTDARERFLNFPFTGKVRVLHSEGTEEWMDVDDFKRALRSGNDD